MTKRAPRKVLPARKTDRFPDEDSLLLRSAESLGRVIGSLQRQVRGASNMLATAATDAADALPELPRFDDVMESAEKALGYKRKSATHRSSTSSRVRPKTRASANKKHARKQTRRSAKKR